jgi:uncharacterized protein YndB with AHSA1/START domain
MPSQQKLQGKFRKNQASQHIDFRAIQFTFFTGPTQSPPRRTDSSYASGHKRFAAGGMRMLQGLMSLITFKRSQKMDNNRIARATIRINATSERVWDALVDSNAIKQYMFGAQVHSDWQEGSAITWKGEWQGKPYEDKGVVLSVKPKRKIQYSHFSPTSGLPDKPENYHTVTIELASAGDYTDVLLAQDNNESDEAKESSQRNWETMLDSLKKYVEQ